MKEDIQQHTLASVYMCTYVYVDTHMCASVRVQTHI